MEIVQTRKPAEDRVHLSGYQARDLEIVDYRMYELGDTGLSFRGPPPPSLGKGEYFTCLGAGQTFGCFCERPYPALLAQRLGLPALNLGYGGAGPEFFLKQEALLPYINRSRFVILQVMSARSQSNSFYESGGLEYVTINRTGEKMGAAAAFDRLLRGPMPHGGRIGRKISRLAVRPRVASLVRELRTAWEESMLSLIDRIEVPVVLFWFSRRTPAYRMEFGSNRKLFGEFPHLVNPEMLAASKARSAAYVESVSFRGSPQPLVSRFTGLPVTIETARDRPDLAGRPWSANHYYPSPEMHEDGLRDLVEPCQRIAAAGMA